MSSLPEPDEDDPDARSSITDAILQSTLYNVSSPSGLTEALLAITSTPVMPRIVRPTVRTALRTALR